MLRGPSSACRRESLKLPRVGFLPDGWVLEIRLVKHQMGMDQYLLIPFLEEWTSIYPNIQHSINGPNYVEIPY